MNARLNIIIAAEATAAVTVPELVVRRRPHDTFIFSTERGIHGGRNRQCHGILFFIFCLSPHSYFGICLSDVCSIVRLGFAGWRAHCSLFVRMVSVALYRLVSHRQHCPSLSPWDIHSNEMTAKHPPSLRSYGETSLFGLNRAGGSRPRNFFELRVALSASANPSS
jgi:hypothetical protein